jgi:hypothetical protein
MRILFAGVAACTPQSPRSHLRIADATHGQIACPRQFERDIAPTDVNH